MKTALKKQVIFTLFSMSTALISCGKKETTNSANDLINSPRGYWATEDSALGQIGWKINDNDFIKCTIALDTKITEETGSIKIDGNRVSYIFKESGDVYTATYHSDDNTLTEDQLLKLKYIRADDNKVSELNSKGCHL